MPSDKEIKKQNEALEEALKKGVHYITHPEEAKKDLQNAAEKKIIETGRKIKNGEIPVTNRPHGPGPHRVDD